MDTTNEDRIKEWIACWKRAGAELESLKRAELPSISTTQALLNLAGAFESCRQHCSPRPSSGLVEQQAWFQKYHDLQKDRES
jgi:hypothetical protein